MKDRHTQKEIVGEIEGHRMQRAEVRETERARGKRKGGRMKNNEVLE